MELPQAVIAAIDGALENLYALQPVFERTVVLVPGFVRDGVVSLSESSGVDYETLSYALGMFLCYPLGVILNAMPFGKMRHVFSFILGAFLLQFTIGVQWIHHFITCIVAYVMFMILPRSLNKVLVPSFVLMYLVFGHLHRQYISYLGWDLDFTGAQMVLTQKLYMMAYNLHDGELNSTGKETRASKKCAKYALKDLPDIIEYLGYTFCFASILCGPAFEFATYQNACNGSLLYDSSGKPKGKIPSNIWPSLKPLLWSIYFLGLFFTIGAQFPLLDPVDPKKNDPVIITADFLANPWWYRFGYTLIGLFFHRHKYYFAWKNAEGANNLWYAGFEGFDEKGEPMGWETSNNVDVFDFETAPSLSVLSKAWNKKTSLWLNRYVYIRTNGSLLSVYALSAFWHGFYPGYYLFFLSVPLLTFCEREGRKKISPHFVGNMFYDLVCRILTSIAANYLVIAFVVLALDRTHKGWISYGYSGHILMIMFYIGMSTFVKSPKKVDDKKAS